MRRLLLFVFYSSLLTFGVQTMTIQMNETAESTITINTSSVEFETTTRQAEKIEVTTLPSIQPVEEPIINKKIASDLCADQQSGACSLPSASSNHSHDKRNSVEVKFVSPSSELDECQLCPSKRFLQHYFAKGCQPVEIRETCSPKYCPKYFRCPKEEELPTDGCKYNSTLYKFGEEVPQTSPCRSCVCINSTLGPSLSCATTDCFNFGDDLEDNCYLKYRDDKCCPEKVCLEKTETLKTCSFENKTHKMGSSFAPKSDPCYTCTCDEHWNQTLADQTSKSAGNESIWTSHVDRLCRKISCDIDSDRAEYRGCVPVYSDLSCCPNYYHCPKEKTEQLDEPKCMFGNDTYEIGEKVKVKQHELCLECHCLVPPEISCKHRTCPDIPENCARVYKEAQCCASAHCSPSSSAVEIAQVKVTEVEDKGNSKTETTTLAALPEPKRKKEIKEGDSMIVEEKVNTQSITSVFMATRTEETVEVKTEAPMEVKTEAPVELTTSTSPSVMTLVQPKSKMVRDSSMPAPTTPLPLSERCPPVGCQFPCIIYRDKSSQCPSCSCTNTHADRKNLTLTSKLSF